MKAAIGLVGLSVVLAAGWAQTVFRADAQLVNVAFSVRNGQGKLVENLTADDLEVLEDGVPQKISYLAKSADVPLSLGLVVDISGSQGAFVKSQEKDLRAFLKNALGPKDKSFLVAFGNRIRLVADYSGPERDLATALVGFEQLSNKTAYPELGPPEIRTGGTAFYDAIYHATTQMLGRADGERKALIVFSDGEENASAHHLLDAIEAAQANNVVLFCVRYTEIKDGRLTAKNKYGTSVMARLAKETGGADFDARERDMAENFRQIGEQLRTAYQLGFQTSNPTSDDTFHKIVIRPKDLTLRVRAKTGYYSRPR